MLSEETLIWACVVSESNGAWQQQQQQQQNTALALRQAGDILKLA